MPAALYPLYWSNFARLRAAGDIEKVLRLFRKELVLVVAGTAALGIAFVAVGPFIADLLSSGKVPRPMPLYFSVAVLGFLAAALAVTLPLLAGSRTAPKVAILVYGLIVPNEALSYVLSRIMGAAGPIVASIAATLVLLGSCAVIIRRDPRCIVDEPVGEAISSG
jgi:Na+-driven multidrug efflux pump